VPGQQTYHSIIYFISQMFSLIQASCTLGAMKSLSPIVVVCVGVFFTSFSSILVRSTDAPAVAVAMYRMWFSVFLLLPLLTGKRLTARARARGGRPSVDKTQAFQTAARPSDIALCLLSGLFLAVHFWIWFESLGLTSIASSTVLVDTHPIFTLLFGFLFLKEKVRGNAVTFIFVAIIGIAVLSFGGLSGGGTDTFTGNLLALGGGVAVSGYILIGRHVRQRMNALTYAIVVYFAAAVTLTGIALASGVSLFDYSPRDYLFFAGLALFCTILGHTLFNWALRFLKAAFLSMIVLTEPLFATILGMIIFKEIPGLSTAIGSAIILFGIFMFVREDGKVIGVR
jgi:drug/metabolite transporter (DMT)-like permease